MDGTTSPLLLLLLLLVGHLSLLSSAISTFNSITPTSPTTTTTTFSSSSGTEVGNNFDDQEAMNILKNAISTTKGINSPPNWDVMDFCSWQGVTCDFQRLRVQSINLSSQDLTGALPSLALNSLQYLDSLFLQNNNFYGVLPCLANLSFLKEIDLSSNSFTSVYPETFSNLTSLTNLSISNNPHLSPWNFPSGLANSTNLLTLSANNASINGPIPEFLGSFRSLRTLQLSHNNFTGTIPNALNSLPSLANIDVSNNKLSGKMPVFRNGVKALYAGNDFASASSSGGSNVGSVASRNESGVAKRSSHVQRVPKVVLIPSIACFLASLIILYFVIWKCWVKRWCGNKQTRAKRVIDLEENNQFSSGCYLKIFTYQELETATDKFVNVLGEGGSSNVFQGELSNGEKVAVKRLKNSDSKFFESEVNALSTTRHCNVVRMVGYCVEGEHRLIVYEYMAEGSLDKCIAKKLLTWDNKKNIIKQIAKGLQYLHKECLDKGNILHRDVKPHNVLLDDKFNAKLSDFGLAQIVSSDRTRSTRGGGTLGYLAPEVRQIGRGKRSLKADVYSYGVVVLDIVFGKKISQQEVDSTPFFEVVRNKFNEDKLHDLIVDSSMDTGENNNLLEMEKAEVKKTVMLALWCLNYNRADRPSMTEVVNVLDGFTRVPEDKIANTGPPTSSNASTQQSSSVLSGPR